MNKRCALQFVHTAHGITISPVFSCQSVHMERANLQVPARDDDRFLDMKILPGRVAVSRETWEERAFAEDASGEFGGYVWPPRSYTCSYCSREFMSAQALGGHMNVHRRDRALLRQPENGSTEAVQLQEHAPCFGCTATYCQDCLHDRSPFVSIPLPSNSSGTPESGTAVHKGASDSSYGRNCYEEADLSITLNSLANRSQAITSHQGEATNRGWEKGSDPSSAHINQHHSGMCSPRSALTGMDFRLVNDLDLELRLGLHPS